MIKQVIVVRKNLSMRKGKIAAQVAHASMGVLLQDSLTSSELLEDVDSNDDVYHREMTIPLNDDMFKWLSGSFTKIVLYVNTDEDWYELIETLEKQTIIPYYVITDNGATEFKGVKTQTCVAIGPAESFKIDQITGSYNLL